MERLRFSPRGLLSSPRGWQSEMPFAYNLSVGLLLAPCVLLQCVASPFAAGILGAGALLFAAFDVVEFHEGAVSAVFVCAGTAVVWSLFRKAQDCGSGFVLCACEFGCEAVIWALIAAWAALQTRLADADARYLERTLLSIVGAVCPVLLAHAGARGAGHFPRLLAFGLGYGYAAFASKNLRASTDAVGANKKTDDFDRSAETGAVPPECARLLALAASSLPSICALLAHRGPFRPLDGLAEALVLACAALAPSLLLRTPAEASPEALLWWRRDEYSDDQDAPSHRLAALNRYRFLVVAVCAAALEWRLCDSLTLWRQTPLIARLAAACFGGGLHAFFTRGAAGDDLDDIMGVDIGRQRSSRLATVVSGLCVVAGCVGVPAVVTAAAAAAAAASLRAGRTDGKDRDGRALLVAPLCGAAASAFATATGAMLRHRGSFAPSHTVEDALALLLAAAPLPLSLADPRAAVAHAIGVAWHVSLDVTLNDSPALLRAALPWLAAVVIALHADSKITRAAVPCIVLGSVGASLGGSARNGVVAGLSLAALVGPWMAGGGARRSLLVSNAAVSPTAGHARRTTLIVVPAFFVGVCAGPALLRLTADETEAFRLVALAVWSFAAATALGQASPTERLGYEAACLGACSAALRRFVFDAPHAPVAALCAAAAAAHAAYRGFHDARGPREAAKLEPALLAFIAACDARLTAAPFAAALVAAAVCEERPERSTALYAAAAAAAVAEMAARRDAQACRHLALPFCVLSVASNVSIRRRIARKGENALLVDPRAMDAWPAQATAVGSYLSAACFLAASDAAAVSGALAAPLLLLLDAAYGESPLTPTSPLTSPVSSQTKLLPAFAAAFAWLALRVAAFAPRGGRDVLATLCCLPAWLVSARSSLASDDASAALPLLYALPLTLAPVLFADELAAKLLGVLGFGASMLRLMARYLAPPKYVD
ncbi:hypothetical protein M885DRAFT_518785 [Pelagophyceae sp. CCMP2097]|nr:hypothetical protein M885DRAFT_518785 [Pelagophyceae sp. CCMP2097]